MPDVAKTLRNAAPDSTKVRQDGIAGVINAVVSVPDGLAAASLVGVNPVYGLYAGISGRFTGGILSSSQIMAITTTSAAALAAGQAIQPDASNRAGTLFLLVMMIGLFQISFGLLRLGTLTQYVSHSVMTGFLVGVASLLVLDQLALFVRYDPEGSNEVAQTIDLFRNASEFHVQSVAIGVLALGIIFGIRRTPLGVIGPLAALIIPTMVVAMLGMHDVDLVKDIGAIPRGLPPFDIPALDAFSFNLAGSAAAIAAIIVVQGTGVSQSFPNPDGTTASPSRDFIAQGAGNVASSLFSGIPVGGSVGQTALNVSTGAVTRWSSIVASIAMLGIVLVVPGLVEIVPMAALGALMVMAGLGAINLPEATSIWRTGWPSRLTIVVTFTATLFLSIPIAVALGVMLSVILFLARASDISVSELVRQPDGSMLERPVPDVLPSNKVTVLDVYGSLFFAGARVLAQRLPSISTARHPAVVLRLRNRTQIGTTLIEVLDRFATDLAVAGGRLYLSGVGPEFHEQLQRSGKLEAMSAVTIVPARETVFDSSMEAVELAEAWLAEPGPPALT